MNSARAGRARTETFEPSFVLDCIFEFALNFRPQSIFLRDRNEAFVFVMLTSAPSPILEVLCGVAKGVVGHARRSMPCISRRERNAVSQPPVPGDLATIVTRRLPRLPVSKALSFAWVIRKRTSVFPRVQYVVTTGVPST